MTPPNDDELQPSGLPRDLREYARSPGRTWTKLTQWLSARWQLRACTKVGPWTRVVGRVSINNHGTMIVGERVQIFSHHARSVFTTWEHGRLIIGDRAFINYGVDIAATGLVAIGADCLIGTHVSIIDNAFHDVVDRQRVPAPKPVIIGATSGSATVRSSCRASRSARGRWWGPAASSRETCRPGRSSRATRPASFGSWLSRCA